MVVRVNWSAFLLATARDLRLVIILASLVVLTKAGLALYLSPAGLSLGFLRYELLPSLLLWSAVLLLLVLPRLLALGWQRRQLVKQCSYEQHPIHRHAPGF